ncbi:hypothetical protein IQ235_00530 [Oscillatoriales cyanobacterium LEGE 11467]|uniref:Uncharacterized protein n=1 Tax=Zarconia navalis LEGE 11467 TaxID=1828826 RepID=A0A928Z7Z1_9CYAN|nr:hypothetical protein [Zarconia navalis]MBE9039281.1 hypothetical protein [Zarconia navalis LEGE 11467]
MKTSNCLISACRSCRYYKPEGRRGGQCQLLGAPVRGGWKACCHAFPPFTPSWEHFEELMTIDSEEATMHERLPLHSSKPSPTKTVAAKSVASLETSISKALVV